MENNHLFNRPIGHDKPLQIFLDCWMSNQLHHAWLLQGTKGIGKAKVAHYISRFVLAQKYPKITQDDNLFGDALPSILNLDDMDIADDNTNIKLYLSGAHPNFISIEKKIEAGKIQSAITVEAIRDLSQQLMKTSGEGYRVILIDAIDDLNRNAANAILKILEEPPKHTLFLLISHNPNKLLPTIISRCRRLSFQPLKQADMEKAIASFDFTENNYMDMQTLLWLSGGAMGRAWQIMSDEGQKLWEDLLNLYSNFLKGNISSLSSFCSTYGRKSKAEEEALFQLLIEFYLRLFEARVFIASSYNTHIPQHIIDLFQASSKIDLDDWDKAINISKQILNGDIDRIVGLNRLLLLQIKMS